MLRAGPGEVNVCVCVCVGSNNRGTLELIKHESRFNYQYEKQYENCQTILTQEPGGEGGRHIPVYVAFFCVSQMFRFR